MIERKKKSKRNAWRTGHGLTYDFLIFVAIYRNLSPTFNAKCKVHVGRELLAAMQARAVGSLIYASGLVRGVVRLTYKSGWSWDGRGRVCEYTRTWASSSMLLDRISFTKIDRWLRYDSSYVFSNALLPYIYDLGNNNENVLRPDLESFQITNRNRSVDFKLRAF